MTDTTQARRVTGHLKLVERREGPVWYVKTRVPGRRPEQTTRRLAPAHLRGGRPRRGALTRKQAEDALGDLLARERHNIGHGAYDWQPDGATFAEAAAGFLAHLHHVKGREFSTLRDYRYSIDGYLNRRWGDRPVSSITPREVEQLRDDLMKRGLRPRTVVRHLTVAHGVFKFAMRRHGLLANPASADLVDRPTVAYTGEFATVKGEELLALARAAHDKQEAALYLVAAMTGLRQGELLALRWGDIDFAGSRIHVRRAWSQAAKEEKAPKSGKVRSVPLVPELVPPLDALSRRALFTGPDDLVFCTPTGQHLCAWRLRRHFRRALAEVGITGLRFHDLRHYFGTVAVRAFPLSDVQAMFGHAHITTTMRYIHHRPGADDAAKLSGAFRSDALAMPVELVADEEADRVPS